MNADDFATIRTTPLYLFIFNELVYTQLPYEFKIFDHAHAILGSIALVDVLDFFTRIIATAETIG